MAHARFDARPTRAAQSGRRRFPALVLVALAAAPALGQEYRFAVGIDSAYDDNILRLPSSVAPAQVGAGDRGRGSMVYRAYVSADAKVPVGRQEFVLNLVGNAFKVPEYSYLDYTALNGGLTWNWQAGERWSGVASYRHTKEIAPFIDFSPIAQNLRTLETARATAEYWLHPSWRPYVGATWTDARSSYAPFRSGNTRIYAGDIGVKYQGAGDNAVRGFVEYSRGEFPDKPASDPFGTEYDQYDIGAEALWFITDRTHLYGRVAYTDRQYPDAPSRDFSGPTGNLAFTWGLTGKTAVRFELRREIGLWEDVATRYYINEVAAITPTWDITAALRLEAGYEHWRRTYPTEGISILPERKDTLDFARVLLKWTPSRSWLVRVGYQWSTRDSNIPLGDFTDNLIFGTVEFALNL